MNSNKLLANITVGLILFKDNEVLMMRRCNTGYMDGKYAFVAGHVENGENLKQALIREAKEEVGIKLKENDLEFVCGIRTGKNDSYINFFFKPNKYENEPRIIEKDKCDDLKWININKIPDNIIQSDKRALLNLKNKIYFDEYDFNYKDVL